MVIEIEFLFVLSRLAKLVYILVQCFDIVTPLEKGINILIYKSLSLPKRENTFAV